jgi:lipid-A-disaccharide synthase
MKVGLVAGEASGDTLGAGLIEAIRDLVPDAEFFGIAGPKMQAAGCVAWESADQLSLLGLVEVLPHLPRLLRLRRNVAQRFIAAAPDVFVGIDAKEFNLSLAKGLRKAGLPTVQYVSPQIWAWRQGRVRSIHESVDLILCLLPFEKRFYDEAGVRAEFVGHPLADAIPFQADRTLARTQLGIEAHATVVALLPGSRRGEVMRLGADFAACARWLAERRPALRFVAPMASAAVREIFAAALEKHAPSVRVLLLDGEAQRALIACDAALVASGTATLEAALCKRPMVVAYRLGGVTAWLLRSFGLVKADFFAQPNLLAGRRVVGEYFQNDISPARIGAEILGWLDDVPRRSVLTEEFSRIHIQLRQGASARAAHAIVDLVKSRRAGA